MNPRNKLSARQRSSAETVANKIQKHIEDAASISAEGHGAPEGNLSNPRSRSGEEGLFPSLRNLNRKVPGVGGSCLVTAKLPGRFIHWPVKSVAVNGCSTGIEPNCRRVFDRGNCLMEDMRRQHTRV